MGRHLLIDGVYQTTTSNSIFLPIPVTEHCVAVNFTDANTSITAVVVELQHSADGRNVPDDEAVWHTLDSYTLSADELTAMAASIQVMSPPVKRVRVKVTISDGGSGDLLYARYIPSYGGNA